MATTLCEMVTLAVEVVEAVGTCTEGEGEVERVASPGGEGVARGEGLSVVEPDVEAQRDSEEVTEGLREGMTVTVWWWRECDEKG